MDLWNVWPVICGIGWITASVLVNHITDELDIGGIIVAMAVGWPIVLTFAIVIIVIYPAIYIRKSLFADSDDL
jgi:hypothetical protein